LISFFFLLLSFSSLSSAGLRSLWELRTLAKVALSHIRGGMLTFDVFRLSPLARIPIALFFLVSLAVLLHPVAIMLSFLHNIVFLLVACASLGSVSARTFVVNIGENNELKFNPTS
jgi:hypothetical protein